MLDAIITASTAINPGCYIMSDLDRLNQAGTTEAERIVEYAGRVCYESTARMGHNDKFIATRMREGHYDIVEHGWASLFIKTTEDLFRWKNICPYLEIALADLGSDGSKNFLVSGNLRAWYDTVEALSSRAGYTDSVVSCLRQVAPSIFGETERELTRHTQPPSIDPYSDSVVKVTLVGSTTPLKVMRHYPAHCAATFLIEGISLTASHQIVRHRTMSFSQRSLRYTDPRKRGDLKTVMPPDIARNAELAAIVRDNQQTTEAIYNYLRDNRIKKEDARFVLPVSTETRLVMSGNFKSWQHFLKLRLDEAAQWEIRGAAQLIKFSLEQLSPDHFS